MKYIFIVGKFTQHFHLTTRHMPRKYPQILHNDCVDFCICHSTATHRVIKLIMRILSVGVGNLRARSEALTLLHLANRRHRPFEGLRRRSLALSGVLERSEGHESCIILCVCLERRPRCSSLIPAHANALRACECVCVTVSLQCSSSVTATNPDCSIT